MLSVTGFAVAVAFLVPNMSPGLVPRPIVGCWSEISRELLLVFIPLASYDLWLWSLVVYKALNRSQGFALSSHFKPNPEAILSVLLRDSTVWFTASLLLWIMTLLVVAYAPIGLHCVAVPVFLSATCISGCRLVMNVRGAVYYSLDDYDDAAKDRGSAERASGGSEGNIGTFRVASTSVLDDMALDMEAGARDFDETEGMELDVFTTSPRTPSSPRPEIHPAWELDGKPSTVQEGRTQPNDEQLHWATVTRQTDERRSSWRRTLTPWGPSDTSTSRFLPSSPDSIEIWVKQDYEVSAAGPSLGGAS